MAVQLINFSSPKDYSTSLFRVVRLRYHKDYYSPKTKDLIHSAAEEPIECYLCVTKHIKKKLHTYEWMTSDEVTRFRDWSIYETSSLQKAQTLVENFSVYFLNLEATIKQSDVFAYGPAYALPTHGAFLMRRVVFQGLHGNSIQYMQAQADETTVVSSVLPYYQNPKQVHWTQTPSKAHLFNTVMYPYLSFIAEFLRLFSTTIGGFPEEYSIHYSHTIQLTYSPTPFSFTLLAAKEGAPPESRLNDLEKGVLTTSRLTPIEELVSSLEQQVPLQQTELVSSATEIEQMHASSYLEQEQRIYQQAERVIDLYCREEMMETWEDLEANKENLDPNMSLEEQEASLYDRWACALEDPVFHQHSHEYASLWEQLHSEGLLASSGTPSVPS